MKRTPNWRASLPEAEGPIKRIAVGMGEPPRPDMPWRVVVALYDEQDRQTLITLGTGTKAQCEAGVAAIRADYMTHLEALQAMGLLPPGPLSRYLLDVH